MKQYLSAAQLLDLLRTGIPHREVYVGRDGCWYVTHGGGPTTAEAVQFLRRQQEIFSVYNTCPEDCFHVGKTIDMTTTLAARKAGLITKFHLIYVNEVPPRIRAALEQSKEGK